MNKKKNMKIRKSKREKKNVTVGKVFQRKNIKIMRIIKINFENVCI